MSIANQNYKNTISNRQVVLLGFISAAIVTAAYIIRGKVGFNLWDEGFLWYGAQRVLLGEVPIRDFMAYDPGRYYWSATFMKILGDNGIISLRIALTLFQWLGLFLALFLVSRKKIGNNYVQSVLLICAASIFMLWMFPSHKLFDITLSIVLVTLLSSLYEKPSIQRYFLTGVVISLVAIFGRNHGVYGLAGSFGLIVYLTTLKRDEVTLFQALKWWALGIVVGYIPMLIAFAFIPGFAYAFLESILFLTEIKGTNLNLPVPWPWLAPFGQEAWPKTLRSFLTGLLFIGVIAYGVLGIAYAVRQRKKNPKISSVFVASVFMALPYAHYAYSRPDVSHLAQGIFPFLIGMLVLPVTKSMKPKIFIAVLLTIVSLIVMLPAHPSWRSIHKNDWKETYVGQDLMKVDPATRRDLDLLKTLIDQYAPDGRAFLATPFWPGAYAVFERKSPMWEIYALFPRSKSFQNIEIQKIKAADPALVIVFDYALDGQQKLRFQNTHPLIDQYIKNNFEEITIPDLPVSYHVFIPEKSVYSKQVKIL